MGLIKVPRKGNVAGAMIVIQKRLEKSGLFVSGQELFEV